MELTKGELPEGAAVDFKKVLAAQLVVSQAELAASKAETEAAEDALARNVMQQSLTALVARFHDASEDGAIKAAPESSPTTGAPMWTIDPDAFSTLYAKVAAADAFAKAVTREIMAAGCTAAPSGCPERPSNKSPGADNVHAHVTPVVDIVAGVIASGTYVTDVSDAALQRTVLALKERAYNDRHNAQIPDHACVITHGTSIQLSAETQVGVVEDKVDEVLSSWSPCVGERQVAGYVAHSLFPAMSCGIHLASLLTTPLSAYGLYTDSATATLVEVRISSKVDVFFSRMPLLPNCVLPKGTVGIDSNSLACGAVAFGLGILVTLRETRLRACAESIIVKSIVPPVRALAFPAKVTFLGRGTTSRAFSCGDYVIKVPLSRLSSFKSWASSIQIEAQALTALNSHPTPCRHFPLLATSGDSPHAATPLCDDLPAGVSRLNLSTIGEVQGLVMSPVCTMLPVAINELCDAIPLCDRSLYLLIMFALSLALPLLFAQAHARSKKYSHFDTRRMNVGLEGWDVAGAKSLLMHVPDCAASEMASKKPRLDISAGSGLTQGTLKMCHRVVLNDWGCAKRTGGPGLSKSRAAAQDTAQVLSLVHEVLHRLLEFKSHVDLQDSSASADVVAWWEKASASLLLAVKVVGELPQLEGINAPRQCVLEALGLVSGVSTTGEMRRSSRRALGSCTTAAKTEPPFASPCFYSDVDSLCYAAAVSAGCLCYSAVGLVDIDAPAPSPPDSNAFLPSLLAFAAAAPTCFAGAGVSSDGEVPHGVAIDVEVTDRDATDGEATDGGATDDAILDPNVIIITNLAPVLSEAVLRAAIRCFDVAVVSFALLPPTSRMPQQALARFQDPTCAARIVSGLSYVTACGASLEVSLAPVSRTRVFLAR